MKGLKSITASVVAALVLTGCSAGEHSAEDIRQSGTIRIAVQDGDNLSALSEHIAESMDAVPEYISTDRQTALAMLSDGSADVAVGFYPESDNPGLAFGLTTPFYVESICAVCPAEEYITSFKELEGGLLGADETLRESIVREVTADSAAGTLYCSDPQQAAEMLLCGELEAYICPESRAAELVKSTEGLRCYLLPDIQAERYCAVVLRENAQLYGEVNIAVGEYLKGGNTDGIF